MPGLPPSETLRALRAIDPSVRVLVTSGYAEPEAVRDLDDLAGFIPKPVTPTEYLAEIRRALRGG